MLCDHDSDPSDANVQRAYEFTPAQSRGICKICGEEVTTFDLRVKVADGYLHQACEDVPARGTEVEARLCIARDSDLRGLVEEAARAVASTPEGLPAEFMSEDDQEVLSILRKHHTLSDDAAVLRASRCTEYLHTRSEVSSCRADVERALAVGAEEEVAQSAARRDAASQQHVAAAQGLLEACSCQVLSLEHAVNQNQSAQRIACRLCELLGDAVIDTDDLSDMESAVGQCISAQDEWERRQIAQSQGLRGNVKEAMKRLGTALQAYVGMLLDTSSNGTCCAGDLVDTRPLAVDLLESIAAQERWMWRLAKEYEEDISPLLRRAAWVAVKNVNMESLQHAALMEAVRGARAVVEDGAHPDQRFMQELGELSKNLRRARRAIGREEKLMSAAKDDIEEAEDYSNEEARADAVQRLTDATSKRKEYRDEIKRLEQQQQALWRTLYRLASTAYPELPAKALQEVTGSSQQGDSPLSFVDPRAARLLAPSRQKDMYDGPGGAKDMHIVSLGGRDSRNDVFHAVFGDSEACLKRFVLGRLGEAGMEGAVRTFQREINSVVKLAHDRVIKPALFFLQAEDGRLCAYVEYPWYKCGSMQQWISSLAAPEADHARAQVRIVLWDVIKALEHVHYHGIVHCDVKQANVLVELGNDGQHRGILADFDLSKDLEARKMASVSALSMASGARGTPGCLTMAPEISKGRQPDAKADLFSFGGMLLQVLFPEEADRWQQGADSDRWTVTGDPQLSKVQDSAARSLLAKVLKRDKDKRPTSSQVVSHSFFSADARAINLMQTLEQGRVHLERQQADYAAALNEHRRLVEEERQSLAEARRKMLQDLGSRQARLDLDRQSMERKESELADAGKRNQDVQEQLQAEEKRLQADREKLLAEMRRQEQELRRRELGLAQKRREEQERLAVERQKIDQCEVELAEKERQASALVRVPAYWKNKTGYHREPSAFVKEALHRFMVCSAACCNAVASKAQVVSVERIENEHLWQMYQTRKSILRKGLAASSVPKLASKTKWRPNIPSAQELDADMNEFYLFHCTSATKAGIIAEHGFDQRVSKLGGRYGAGNYFASNACKSHQYSEPSPGSGIRVMLVCRVVMGLPYCAASLHKNARRAPDNPETPGRPFDSVFAEAGVIANGDKSHNEYVIYDQSQVYPEYVVHYRV